MMRWRFIEIFSSLVSLPELFCLAQTESFWRGIQLNYWVSKSFSKLFSKSYLAWCNSIELLKLILKILLRWILLKGHVPTSITALVGNLFQKDFEKDFQNVNRIAKVKNMFLKMNFKKIFKMIFNNPIEFLFRIRTWHTSIWPAIGTRAGSITISKESQFELLSHCGHISRSPITKIAQK